jgi:hypothetical protein
MGEEKGGKTMMKKLSDKLKQNMKNEVLAAAPWYVGDPCYIIPDDDWSAFCEATFKEENRAKGNRMHRGHIDSVIDWFGQKITIWSNGGDGTWTFNGLESANGATSFGVDAGIFCVINLNDLPAHEADISDGILFTDEPELYVDDGVVYLNGQHDDSVQECEGWRCRRIITPDEAMSCNNGNCEEGCDSCFECSCCDECGNDEDDCECGEEE